jgi:mRNA interferase RelE/StbE
MQKPHYEILYKKSVDKDLRKLPPTTLKQIVSKIQKLSTEPYPVSSTKLRGAINLYRIRHTNYRIIYQVEDDKLIVLVVKVGHRKEVYRDI